ncbi:MAG TPA: HAD family hydrolase [Candidatus Angelobacter sp.]|nr:HAD family hydrolase [Candidatus Angelobacter sp.]
MSRINPRKPASAAFQRPVIRCAIFDLDDTLYDCMGQRVRPAHRHAAQAMVDAGLKANVEAVYRARMSAFRRDPTLRYIDAEVCRQFQADDPERISEAARDAYFHCPVGKLTLFSGTLPLLRFLHGNGVRVFIVSFGEPATQRAKTKALGLDNEPSVEAIFYADRDKLLTKEAAFRNIQKQTGVPVEQILVVGDRPLSEIRAGNDLGMHTVRIHRGEFISQEPAGPEEQPDYVVKSISEVRKLPFAFGTSLKHKGKK